MVHRHQHTVAWFPHDLAMPGPSIHDILVRTIDDLQEALHKFSAAAPSLGITAQPASLITTMANNLHIIANMHLPPVSLLSHSTPQSSALTDPASEQKVSPPPPSFAYDDNIARESIRPLRAQPLRPSVPLPPTLYTTLYMPLPKMHPVSTTQVNLSHTRQPNQAVMLLNGRSPKQKNSIAFSAHKSFGLFLLPTNRLRDGAIHPTTIHRPRKIKLPLASVLFASEVP